MPMNKKTFIAALAVTAILISLVGMQSVEVAKANFIYPTTKPKLITNISSPANNSIYNQDKIRMIFRGEVLDWTDPIYGHLVPTEVYVSCYLDNKLLKTYSYSSSYFVYALENLTNGQHEAKVTMRCVYPGILVGGYDSSIVYFTIQTSTNTSSPTTITTPTISPTLTITPTPLLSPSPILTITAEPTLEPAQTPTQTSDGTQAADWTPVALVFAVVVAVAVAALVYLKRRRKP